MSQTKTVSINGRQYDPVSGLPIANAENSQIPLPEQAAAPSRAISASNIHTTTERSKTLRRSSLKRPEVKPRVQATHQIINHNKPRMQDIRAPKHKISKFVAPASQTSARRVMDVGPIQHPNVAKAQAKVEAKKTPAPIKPSHIIKQELTKEAVAKTSKKQPKKSWNMLKLPGTTSIVTAGIALVLLGGYLTYLNIPSLSVRIAAASSGVDASYPNYRPDGYSLDCSVAYKEGEVSMKFAANAGPHSFTIKQTESSWDSSAVLQKYVIPKAGKNYATYSERGLTIYSFDDGAAWVNGGVLYTIEGNARLSSEQIRHMATSFS